MVSPSRTRLSSHVTGSPGQDPPHTHTVRPLPCHINGAEWGQCGTEETTGSSAPEFGGDAAGCQQNFSLSPVTSETPLPTPHASGPSLRRRTAASHPAYKYESTCAVFIVFGPRDKTGGLQNIVMKEKIEKEDERISCHRL